MDRSRINGVVTDELQAFLDMWHDDGLTVEAHTSGSTGEPKAIALLKEDMRKSAESTCRFFGLDERSQLGLVLPASYIAGRMVAVRADVCGGRLYSETPSSHPLRALDNNAVVDLLSVVPSQVDGLLDSPALGRVRAVLVGGAPLDAAREQRLASVGTLAAYATYGMTETCSNVALRRLGQPIFVANEGFSFATDRRGCLVIRTDLLSFGEMVTNDVVRLYDEHHFAWVGRADNVINSGGVKLHPELIEAKLAAVLPAGHFFVSSRASRRWGRELVVATDVEVTAEQRAQAEAVLQRYERPKEWIRLEALPLTANGKIKRITF